MHDEKQDRREGGREAGGGEASRQARGREGGKWGYVHPIDQAVERLLVPRL